MNKNKKLQIIVSAIFSVILMGAAYTYHSFALPDDLYTADANGIEVSYPTGWKKSSYQFHTTVATTQPGILIASPDQKVNVGIAPKYVGDLQSEHPESSGMQAEAMLVASTPAKDLPGVSAVQLVMHYYGAPGASHYVARDVLMTNEQLQKLGLEHGKMHAIDTSTDMAISPKAGQQDVTVGFNSQEPLTLDQAIGWLKTPEAQAAHAILLSVRLSERAEVR